MSISNLPSSRFLLLQFCLCFIPIAAWAQAPSPESRVVERVNESALVALRGNTHPLAQSQFDRGPAPPDLPMERMLLVLKRSDAQESVLQGLLDAQQDPNSPSYHQWLTPDEFGRQFGPSDPDIQSVVTWLQSHGFQVSRIAKGHTVIEFAGTALQVQQTFHAAIHKYTVNGADHWANASDPQIPQALSPVIVGVNSLHNFLKTPAHHVGGIFSKSRRTGEVKSLHPGFTFPNSNLCGPTNCYFLGPYDFAKIYNISPLWNATPAIDGTGQSITNIGRSDIVLQDVRDFRNLFGLPPNDPNFIIDGTDPGLVPGDETEATLDVEWSGAVARGATINLVISASTETTDGVDLSALYAVDNNTAPVINESFLQCELYLGTAGNAFQDALREQASAQGITFITAAGDQGAAGCDFGTGNVPEPATHGLMVNGLSSSPHGVAVGGTDFLNFGPNVTASSLNLPSPYWSANNDTHQASALGYIPESTWNSTCANNIFAVLGFGVTPEASCNNAQLLNLVDTEAGGGGKSNCITSDGATPASCSGGYPKPSWQSAPGVPADGARDIPDVSLFASPGFMNSAYIVCEADQTQSRGTCGLTGFEYDFLAMGGTSASAPAFAGIMAMVNQYTQSAGQGNANHVLYKLASSSAQTSAKCNSSAVPAGACIFNDITSGTIATPCVAASLNCSLSNVSDTYGVLSGYKAGVGYDLATGLGSVNAYNLVHGWVSPGLSTTTTLSLNNGQTVNITHGASVSFSIAISPSAATGDVSLIGSPAGGKPIAMEEFTLQNGSASGTETSLAGGTSYQVKAHYAGDSTYATSDSAPVTVTVAPEASTTLITFPVFDPNLRDETGDSPTSLVYGSPYILRVDVGNATAKVTFPMKPVCAQPACPTGSVTLTDSVTGGASGVFQLNSQGYTEDQAVQLTGGAHQISASYPGDNSYHPSTGAYSITVTPVATSIGQSFTVTSPVVGTPFYASVIGYSQAISGVAPTGTVTFYDGKTQIGSSGPISGYPAGYNPQIFAEGTLTVVSGGARTISAQYSGDANYAASTSSTTLNALYPATASISASPSTVTYGASVTITGVINTSIPATNAALKPTGAVLVVAPLGGNNTSAVTTTTNADPNGNWQIQVSATAIPSGSEQFNLNYSGDSNYAPVTAYSNLVTVNIPDFSLGPAAGITIVPMVGQAGSAQLTVTPLSQTPSPVTLMVYSPISMSGYTIAITPQTINLSGAPVTATISLTPTVTAPTNSIQSQVRHASLIGPGRGVYWPLSVATGLAALFLVVTPRWRRKYRVSLGLTAFCFVLFVLGCGAGSSPSGGGGSGGGGSGGGGSTGPQPTTITLSTSSAKVARYTPLPITATVTSASGDVITGSVTFYNFGVSVGSGYSIVSGQYTFQGDDGELGIFQVTASYSGDSNHLPSTTSSPLIQMVTGSVPVTITGNTGVNSHNLAATIGLQ